MNLVVNARDAMPEGGKLTLELANVELDETYARTHLHIAPGPHVMLAVSDTGTGMDAATRARIFEPFFTTKQAGKGTGLGLATVYGIVRQSGGSVWVYSEVGQGTTFKIYLPAVQDGLEAETGGAGSSPTLMGTETVLVVEDEETVRVLAENVLRTFGYEVVTAREGEEALQICGDHPGPIHVLLTDVVMPGMSGRDLALKAREIRPSIQTVFMSGYPENAIVRNGALKGDSVYLQKPFTPDGLARKIREVLDR
jgi:CheY-like chemotaxis protein